MTSDRINVKTWKRVSISKRAFGLPSEPSYPSRYDGIDRDSSPSCKALWAGLLEALPEFQTPAHFSQAAWALARSVWIPDWVPDWTKTLMTVKYIHPRVD